MLPPYPDHPLALEAIPSTGDAPALACARSDRRPAAIVFVHGACCDSRIWEPVMRCLKSFGLPTAALSLRGHGASEGQAQLQSWGIEDYEADVMRCLDAVAESRPVLVGHSMGGLIAQRVAARRPLRSLVLMASSPVDGMRRDGIRMATRHPLAFWAAAKAKSFLRLYRNPRVCRSLLLGPSASKESVAKLQAMLGEESWRAGNELNTLLPNADLVRCPVEVVGGRSDNMVSIESVERTALAYTVIPRWFENAGHMLPLEVASERLAVLLLRSWSWP